MAPGAGESVEESVAGGEGGGGGGEEGGGPQRQTHRSQLCGPLKSQYTVILKAGAITDYTVSGSLPVDRV